MQFKLDNQEVKVLRMLCINNKLPCIKYLRHNTDVTTLQKMTINKNIIIIFKINCNDNLNQTCEIFNRWILVIWIRQIISFLISKEIPASILYVIKDSCFHFNVNKCIS